MIRKRFFMLFITGLFIISAAMGQANPEMSIEESYLQETIELIIIRETSKSGSRELQLIALEQIEKLLARANAGSELLKTELIANLEYLALEGVQRRVMQGNRTVNNFPDVRRQAVMYLGVAGTREAKNALVNICIVETDPMVLYEAMNSLAAIDINDNDDVVNVIIRIAQKNNNAVSPNNYIAFAAINALEQFTGKNNGANAGAREIISLMQEGRYAFPVRERARKALYTWGN